MGILSLRFSAVQTYIAQQLAKKLSNDLHTTITIEKVDIHPFSKAEIKSIHVQDLEGDTILQTESITVLVSDIKLKANELHLASVTLENPLVKLIKRKGKKGFSFQFILDYFSSESKHEGDDKSNFLLTGNEIKVNKGNFFFIDHRSSNRYYGIDFKDLALLDLDLVVSNIKNKGSCTSLSINHLATSEKTGFTLNELKANLIIDSNFTQLDSLVIHTKKSIINAPIFRFDYANPNDFNDDFEKKVTITTSLRNVDLALEELAYFTPFFEGIARKVKLETDFKGTIHDFKCSNLSLSLSSSSKFSGDIAMKGLPDSDNMYFDVDIRELITNEHELSQLELPPFKNGKKLILPQEISGIGLIDLHGKMEGKLEDFTNNISINTSLGSIYTKGNLVLNKKNNSSQYIGEIKTSDLAVGKVVGAESFKKLNLSATSTLIWSKLGYDAQINGEVSSFIFQDYEYKNLSLNGNFNDEFFNGKATLNDPNAKLTFDGKVNYKSTLPEFDFKSTITSFDLTKTNLIRDTVTRIVCSKVIINGEGSELDNLNGFAIIDKLSYYQDGIEYEADEIEIVASPKDNGKILNITSSLVDATIDGVFSFKELPKVVDHIIDKTIPVLNEKEDSSSPKDTTKIKNKNFTFNALVKNYKPVNKIFTPKIDIAKNTFVTGTFDSSDPHFDLLLKSDSIRLDKRIFYGVDGNIEEKGNFVELSINVDKGFIQNNLSLENINFKTTIKENLLEPSIKWKSNDGTNYGYIEGSGYWYSFNYFDFLLLPSYAHFQNATWNSGENAQFIMEGDLIEFDNFFAINNKNEKIAIKGKISHNENDKLEIILADFKLENLNDVIGSKKVKYSGNINGSACLTNIYNEPHVSADFLIANLKANSEFIGDLIFSTNWQDDVKALECKGELTRENNNAFDFFGKYYPFKEENSLDFKCIMDGTPISFISSYLENQGISQLYGYVSGNVNIKGDPKNPLLDGNTFFENIGFRVDYLNTYYDFSGEVIIENNDIYTHDVIEIRDMTDNLAMFNGQIYHKNFSDFNFDIFIMIPEKVWGKGYKKELKKFEGAKLIDNKFYCLNTTSRTNTDFYGNVYTVGDINIGGYDDQIEITVNAKTREGTIFTLPLQGSSDIALEDYILFTDSTTNISDETVKLDGIDLTLNIEATPDAELRIIFDEVYGDIMKGKGSGNLSLSVNKNNELEMAGKYEIEKGDYLFTMGVLNFENVINKRFQVASGSSINWYGDPYNAEIDINAIYKLKASLYDIMTSYSEEEKARYKNRTDVDVYMNLTQSLMQPNIDFEIVLPRADENAKTALSNLISTKQELNKQVFSLLILNRFLPPANFVSDESRSGSSAVGSTASELLSNQVSNWLSQITNTVDLGFNYRPGDNISDDELALALSTELLNDRLVIATNFGVSTTNQNNNSNAVAGDISVEYKLNKDGSFRVRAFTRTNDYDVTNTQQSTTTQGVGLYYKKEFNTLKDLLKLKKGN